MLKIPLEYRKQGFDYKQVFRTAHVAIYEQWSEGQLIAHEVSEIIQAKAGMVFDNWVEEREKLPSTEQWGTKAFTCKSFDAAVEKAKYLTAQVLQRPLNKAS